MGFSNLPGNITAVLELILRLTIGKRKESKHCLNRTTQKKTATALDPPPLDVGTNAIDLSLVPDRNCKDGSSVTKASNVQNGNLVVDSVGKSGGLCMIWDNSIIVDLLSYWNTGFYGHPVQAQRLNFWILLRRLTGLYNLPWVVLGDFYEIMFNSKNVGGTNKNWWDMAMFREAVEDSELEDMGFVRAKFTWSNKRDVNSGAIFFRILLSDTWISGIRIINLLSLNVWISQLMTTLEDQK
ncbi:hypothetical protein Ddye_012166 [Dipteronia dyeriana]|uniref:Uncharacterized protein n=1 Tax=Dipteronia dyeriana TaxID=168575 RepID=A0AAD9X3Y5_9ROSI|nr:hypothetical protein Ddye_012166 [Dipteronia dyeriana]